MTKDVTCPYCGHDFDVCHDDGAHYQDDHSEYEICPACSKYMMVHTSICYYHEAREAECLNTKNPKDSDHDWQEGYHLKGDGMRYGYKRCRTCDKRVDTYIRRV